MSIRFIDENGVENEVVSKDVLVELVKLGRIRAHTLVFDTRTSVWRKAGDSPLFQSVQNCEQESVRSSPRSDGPGLPIGEPDDTDLGKPAVVEKTQGSLSTHTFVSTVRSALRDEKGPATARVDGASQGQPSGLALKGVTAGWAVALALGFAALLIAFDLTLGILLAPLVKESPNTSFRSLVYVLYCCGGVFFAADYFARRQRMLWISACSFAALLLARLVMASVLSPSRLMESLSWTFVEGFAVFSSLLLVAYILRKTSRTFPYAEVTNARKDVADPVTGSVSDLARCSACGEDTIVASWRCPSLSLLGKSTRYRCSSCGISIGVNPIAHVFVGVAEMVFSGFCVVSAAVSADNRGGGFNAYTMLFVLGLLWLWDGLRRTFSGVHLSIVALRRWQRSLKP